MESAGRRHRWTGLVAAVALGIATFARAQACPEGQVEPSALDLRPAAEPLRVTRSGMALHLAWEDTVARYVVGRGNLAALGRGQLDHAALDCEVAGNALDVPDDASDVYFVVAARIDELQGSFGRGSFGQERGGPTPACPSASTPCAGPVLLTTLPGACIEFATPGTTATLAEAAAGLTIPYQVVVDAPLEGVTALSHACDCCGDEWVGGLVVFEELSGGGQRYCICDTGVDCDCVPVTGPLFPGTTPTTFEWNGVNSTAPWEIGPAFPPGTYTLEVSAVGTLETPSGPVPFRVTAQHAITLVP